ncbi:hypothetical protein CRYUN_Cryun32bG0073100 [Craigia yunnanensis]
MLSEVLRTDDLDQIRGILRFWNLDPENAKIHLQVPHASLVSVPFTTSKQENFTIWMKSLILSGKGCTVFDSSGQIVYRVDNYNCKCSNEVFLMDFTGKVLFTIGERLWEGYRSFNGNINDEDKNPAFQDSPLSKSCTDLNLMQILLMYEPASLVDRLVYTTEHD